MNLTNVCAGNVCANSSGSIRHGAATIAINTYLMNCLEYLCFFMYVPIDSRCDSSWARPGGLLESWAVNLGDTEVD